MVVLQESSDILSQSDAHKWCAIGTFIKQLTCCGLRHHLFWNALAFKSAADLEQELLFPGLEDRQLSALGAVSLPGLMQR
jgi:hypothetical protein